MRRHLQPGSVNRLRVMWKNTTFTKLSSNDHFRLLPKKSKTSAPSSMGWKTWKPVDKLVFRRRAPFHLA